MIDLDECPCSGKTLSKLLQPAVMTILAAGELHGYKIVGRLAETPTLAGDRPDPTGVYRLLHAMQERGLVVSSWDTSGAGPAKKTYQLTRTGRRCLARWITSLAEYHKAIGELLASAKRASAELKKLRRAAP
ncbi:MAG: transcriptional regulator [Planctomycetes bacterium SM23_65]|nr:MAG: transcriptional regulator [Planctomycetes bacterium SM23_65]